MACSIHGVAASIVAWVSCVPGINSSAKRRVAGKELFRLARAVFALVRVGPSSPTAAVRLLDCEANADMVVLKFVTKSFRTLSLRLTALLTTLSDAISLERSFGSAPWIAWLTMALFFAALAE